MERDFLGLGSKNQNVAVSHRDEFSDHSKTSGALVSGSGMQWSFSNKVSAVPRLLSFRAAQEERQRKPVFDQLDQLLSSGYVTTLNTDIQNLTHRPFSAVMQKNVAPDKKAGSQFAMAVSNPPKNACPLALNVPVFQSQVVSSGQTVVGSSINLQPIGGVPVATSVSVPPSRISIIGTADLRNASKSPGASPQLTIFYAGSVSVYNDISPEKAQAIMLLAGSGPPQTQNNLLPTGQVQAPFPSDAFKGMPVLSLSSPLSAAPSKASHAAVVSCTNSELPTAKPIQTPSNHASHSEPSKAATSVGCIAPTFVPAALPQARKASLARFLEKRKERITTSPYGVAKKTSESCSSSTFYLTA